MLELPISMCRKDQPEATVMKKQLKIWASIWARQRPARRRAEPHPGGHLPLGDGARVDRRSLGTARAMALYVGGPAP